MWVLELLQPCENVFDIIVVQSVGHLLGGSVDLCHMLRLPGLLQPEPLSRWQATADPASAGDKHKGRSGSVSAGSLGPGVHKVLFEPSKHLWQVRGLFLNGISHLLPSCRGFSCALGRGVPFFGGIQHSSVNGCSAVS